MMAIPEELKPIHPEPLDAREVERIRVWLELNLLRLNQREAKRSTKESNDEGDLA